MSLRSAVSMPNAMMFLCPTSTICSRSRRIVCVMSWRGVSQSRFYERSHSMPTMYPCTLASPFPDAISSGRGRSPADADFRTISVLAPVQVVMLVLVAVAYVLVLGTAAVAAALAPAPAPAHALALALAALLAVHSTVPDSAMH